MSSVTLPTSPVTMDAPNTAISGPPSSANMNFTIDFFCLILYIITILGTYSLHCLVSVGKFTISLFRNTLYSFRHWYVEYFDLDGRKAEAFLIQNWHYRPGRPSNDELQSSFNKRKEREELQQQEKKQSGPKLLFPPSEALDSYHPRQGIQNSPQDEERIRSLKRERTARNIAAKNQKIHHEYWLTQQALLSQQQLTHQEHVQPQIPQPVLQQVQQEILQPSQQPTQEQPNQQQQDQKQQQILFQHIFEQRKLQEAFYNRMREVQKRKIFHQYTFEQRKLQEAFYARIQHTQQQKQQVIQSQTIQPQAIQPQAIQPQAIQPQAIQPQAIQPQAIQPQAIQPQTVQLQTVQPQTVQLQVHQPQMPQQHQQAVQTQSIPPKVPQQNQQIAQQQVAQQQPQPQPRALQQHQNFQQMSQQQESQHQATQLQKQQAPQQQLQQEPQQQGPQQAQIQNPDPSAATTTTTRPKIKKVTPAERGMLLKKGLQTPTFDMTLRAESWRTEKQYKVYAVFVKHYKHLSEYHQAHCDAFRKLLAPDSSKQAIESRLIWEYCVLPFELQKELWGIIMENRIPGLPAYEPKMKPRALSFIFLTWNNTKVFSASRKQMLITSLKARSDFMALMPGFNEKSSPKEIFRCNLTSQLRELIWNHIAENRNALVFWNDEMSKKTPAGLAALAEAREAYAAQMKAFPDPTRNRTAEEWRDAFIVDPCTADDDTDSEGDNEYC